MGELASRRRYLRGRARYKSFHATQKTSAGADVFVWCIIFYNFPHCLPVKKRRVVVARNTLPARSTVVGNSGWEGLQG